MLIVGDVVTLDELRIIKIERLNTTRQKVHVIEALLGEYFSCLRSMPLIVSEHYDDLVFEVLEAQEGTEMILTIDPAVREAHRPDNVEVVEFFLRCDAFTTHIEKNYILLRQLE